MTFMHPELAYDIARSRHAELTRDVHRHASGVRVRFWRRRRHAAAVAKPRLVAIAPPDSTASLTPLARHAELRLAARRSA